MKNTEPRVQLSSLVMVRKDHGAARPGWRGALCNAKALHPVLGFFINKNPMLKKLFLVFAVVLFCTPAIASASSTSCVWNSVLNRMDCTTSPDAQDIYRDIQQKLDALKSQYGSSAYYACYAKSGLGSSMGSDPYVLQSGYNYIKYCLEAAAQQNKAGNDIYNKIQCSNPDKYPNGAVWFNGRCVDYDTGCRENFGPNSRYRGMDGNGKLLCEDKPVVTAPVIPTPSPVVVPAPVVQPSSEPAPTPQTKSLPPSRPIAKAPTATPTVAGVQDQEKQPEAVTTQPVHVDPAPQAALPVPEVKKPSLGRRIINWFKHLFGRD